MKAFFDQIHKVEDELLDEYLKAWQTYEVPKKTIMTCEGDVERYMYFVLEGVQKSYYLKNGKRDFPMLRCSVWNVGILCRKSNQT